MKDKKQLCSGADCYNTIEVEWDIIKRADGTDHPLSLKCYNCISDTERKSLKNYKKRLRLKDNHRTNPQ